MKLSLTAVIEGVRIHLSPRLAVLLAEAVPAYFSLPEVPQAIDDEHVGPLLISGLLPGIEAKHVELAEVQLTPAGDETVRLNASDAFCHPLLAGMPENLYAAVGAPIIAGARAHFGASNVPVFTQVDVAEAEGHIFGALRARIAAAGGGVLGAIALYGDVGRCCPLLTTRCFQGAALFEVGRHARRVTQAGAPPVPLPPTAPKMSLGTSSIH